MPIPRRSLAYTCFLGALSALPPMSIDMGLPALERITRALDTTPAMANMTLSIFLLGFATAPLILGPLSDRFGRRPILLVGLCVFTLAGLACAGAQSIRMLLLVRLIQGAGAGAGAVLPLAIVRDVFEGTEARSRLAYVTLVLGLAPAIAPSLGAVVLNVAGWRGIYALLFFGGVALLLAVFFGFEETRDPSHSHALRPAQLLRSYGHVLGNRATLGYALVNGLTFACMFAYISGSPLVFITGFGVSERVFGLIFCCTAIGTMSGAILVGRLGARHLRPASILNGGLALGVACSAGLTLLSATGHAHVATLLPLLFLSNSAYGVIGPNASHEALLPMARLAGVASAVLRSLQMILGAAASAATSMLSGGNAALAMTSVMAACAVGSLCAYLCIARTGARPPAVTAA